MEVVEFLLMFEEVEFEFLVFPHQSGLSFHQFLNVAFGCGQVGIELFFFHFDVLVFFLKVALAFQDPSQLFFLLPQKGLVFFHEFFQIGFDLC